MRREALHPRTALFVSHCLVLDQAPSAIHPSLCSGEGAELGLLYKTSLFFPLRTLPKTAFCCFMADFLDTRPRVFCSEYFAF